MEGRGSRSSHGTRPPAGADWLQAETSFTHRDKHCAQLLTELSLALLVFFFFPASAVMNCSIIMSRSGKKKGPRCKVILSPREMQRCVVCRCHGQRACFLPEMSHFSPRQNVIHSHLLPSSQPLPTLCSFKLGLK